MQEITRCIQALGLGELAPPIFYNCPNALRFEIGDPALDPYDGEGHLSKRYAAGAFLRAKALFDAVPGELDRLLWVTYPQRGQEQSQLQAFQRLTAVPPPQEVATQLIQGEDGFCKVSYCWNLPAGPLDIGALLEGIIAADLGGFSPLSSAVYFFGTGENLLYHLYDDRGLDIAAARRESLLPLYQQFHDWLLPYDRCRMEELFRP